MLLAIIGSIFAIAVAFCVAQKIQKSATETVELREEVFDSIDLIADDIEALSDTAYVREQCLSYFDELPTNSEKLNYLEQVTEITWKRINQMRCFYVERT